MSEPKKPAKSTKAPKPDVSRPGKTAPDTTAKPVIVTNRPLLRDPMVVGQTDEDDVLLEKKPLEHTTSSTIQPLGKSTKPKQAQPEPKEVSPKKASKPEANIPAATEEEPASKNENQSEPSADLPAAPDKAEVEAKKQEEPKPTDTDTEDATQQTDTKAEADDKTKEKLDSEAVAQAKHAAEVQKLIDSKKYMLPINAVEKRKTKRFLVLGILLAVFLALAWVDIALDAGIIHLSGIQPVTHFFSN